MSGVAAGVIIALLAGFLYLVLTDDQPDGTAVAGSTSDTPSPSATTSEEVSDEPSPSKTPREKPRRPKTAATVGDVRDLPAGVFCRDLNARGYSYVAAVDYWRMHGQPNQMDTDGNGVPCETVYPDSDVAAYWGEPDVPDVPDVPDTSLSAGLFCRDLYAQGLSYADAVAYWWSYGSPDRMDEDLNGIPCETVYPSSDVDAFW